MQNCRFVVKQRFDKYFIIKLQACYKTNVLIQNFIPRLSIKFNLISSSKQCRPTQNNDNKNNLIRIQIWINKKFLIKSMKQSFLTTRTASFGK